MTRIFLAASTALLLAACGGEPPKPAEPVAPTAPVEPAPAPEAVTPLPATDARVGTMNLMCGGESFRVAFLDTHAAMVSADGATTTELPILSPDPNAAPGVSTYTDGKVSFFKSGGGDTPTVIRYAKGRMAPQDCAIAVN